jgi:PmbA protein
MTDAPELLDRLASLVDQAKRAGADAADAVVAQSQGLEVAYRLGERESLERAESMDLGLRVFVGDRTASVATGDLSQKTLAGLVERAVAMAKAAPPDPSVRMAPADQLADGAVPPGLDLIDTSEATPEQLADMAKAAEAAMLEVSGVSNSEGAGASWGRTDIALATTNGFAGAYGRTSFGFSTTAIAERDGLMERDYDYASATHLGDLAAAETVGRTAGERAVRRLGAKRVKSQAVPVVFEQRLAGGLLRSLAGAINGAAIARGVSFLKDKMGEQLFPPGVTVIDDPLRPRGMASKPFDAEGLAVAPIEFIQDGALQSWVLDLRSAGKLGLESNGRASRGIGSSPSPSVSNLDMQPGSISPEAMIGEIEDGFYVTELIGHGADIATGDYSRGASGFWIENGEITHPVNELTIASNLKDMFLMLTPANDLVRRGSVNAPTVRIDGMTIAGQ